MTKTVSAKIPDDLKAKLDELGVNQSETIRAALEAEVRRKRREKLAERSQALADTFGDDAPTTEEVVTMIREDRDAEDR